MCRIGAIRALGVLLVSASVASAWDGPPPLTPPASEESPAPAPAPSPAPTTAPEPENRPVLVVPGVPNSAAPRSRPRLSALEPIAPINGDLPTLTAPAEMPEPATSRPGTSRFGPRQIQRGTALPLTLESTPIDADPLGSTPGALPSTRRNLNPEIKPVPAPRRPSGFFGRMLPTPFTSSRPQPETRGSITVEPRTDPAADAALKRRLERQVREAVGDRVKAVEVRVVGRDVTIRAKVSRFWYRRPVRHTLETLPGLSGYRSTVEVVD